MKRFAVGMCVLALATPALAQAPQLTGSQEPGATAGSSYVPSTHTPGCGGLFCYGNDPKVAARPPKPCQAVICDDPPYTARDAQLAQERARAEAAVAAPPPAPEKRTRVRKARAKAPKAAIAARTPAPAEATPAPAR